MLLENKSIKLMAARAGYISMPPELKDINPQKGINIMAKELHYRGGDPQQNRMIRDKRKALDKAVLYSY